MGRRRSTDFQTMNGAHRLGVRKLACALFGGACSAELVEIPFLFEGAQQAAQPKAQASLRTPRQKMRKVDERNLTRSVRATFRNFLLS